MRLILDTMKAVTRVLSCGYFVQEQDDGQWAVITPDGKAIVSQWPSKDAALRTLRRPDIPS